MALSIEKEQARQRGNLSIQGRAKKISSGRAELVDLKKNFSGRRKIMPTIFFYGPKLEKEKSKEMIRDFTETASRIIVIEKSAFIVYLGESTPRDVGVGGELLRLKGT